MPPSKKHTEFIGDSKVTRMRHLAESEELEYWYTSPTSMAPYTYRLIGKRYGREFSVNMNRQGAIELMLAIQESLL